MEETKGLSGTECSRQKALDRVHAWRGAPG